ncbi:response regulator [Pontiellaceae bacterium B1224]|nr:response regulator [Pontiellaceae bacterium B1224]
MNSDISIAIPEKDRILVIDDNRATRMFLVSMLQNAGYEVLAAETGTEGIEIADSQDLHLILLDIILPDISGYEVCRILKGKQASKTRPIVFISALNDEDAYIKGLRLGALDLITKPINIKILLTKVRTLVQLSKDECQLKQMHSELQDSCNTLKQFSQALDNASDGVVIGDRQGAIVYANTSFERLIGRSINGKNGLQLSRFVSDKATLDKAIHHAQEGISLNILLHVIRGEESIPVQIKCSPILDGDNLPSGLLFVVVDESEREAALKVRTKLEADLLHAQKLESVGQLASGIAHEINTPTQFVGDNIRFIQDSINDLFELQVEQEKLFEAARSGSVDESILNRVERALETADMEYLREELPSAIEQSLEGIDRVATIVRAMKDFAHPGKTERSPANLNEAIQTTTIVARNKWKYVAELELKLDDNLPAVPCLLSEFNQVVLNLIVNAGDAIAERFGTQEKTGLITITTTFDEKHAIIDISDNGGGIPEQVQSRIFDPFFTTKEVGKGSGQGLAIAQSVIVTKHQGELLFKTEPGESTTFTIKLPL